MNYKINRVSSGCGFFSDLIHGIFPSIIYLKDNNIDNFHINWENYLYQKTTFNIYNHFFKNNKDFESYDYELNSSNCPYGFYFTSYNDDEKLKKGNEIVKLLNLHDCYVFSNVNPILLSDKKILGVQQRHTDHSLHAKLLDDFTYINKVSKYFDDNGFDYVFLITDSHTSLNNFKEYFGDKLLYNENIIRSKDKIAIHHMDNSDIDKIKLAEDVLLDSYSLSLTDYKFLCDSNVSTFSLFLNYNPSNFEYIDK